MMTVSWVSWPLRPQRHGVLTVIVVTVLFLPLLVKGSNGSFSDSFVGDLPTSSTILTTTLHQDNETIFLWIPLIVVIIFGVVITTLIIVGRQTQPSVCKCLGVSSGSDSVAVAGCQNLHLNVNLQISLHDPMMPETPPPSYSVIAREISCISTISQTSSQIEIPPGYDEALDITEGSSEFRTKKRVTQLLLNRSSMSSPNQLSRSNVVSRLRLLSWSSPTTDSSQRPSLLRQSSSPTAAIIHENLDMQIPEASLNMTALDVIQETAGTTDETQSSQSGEDRSFHSFYIEETNNDDSVL